MEVPYLFFLHFLLLTTANRKCDGLLTLLTSGWPREIKLQGGTRHPISALFLPALTEMTKDELCSTIFKFLCEVIKESGDDYPGQTLYEMLINIQMHLEQCCRIYKFLKNEAFIQIKNTLDHVMKQRSASGLGINKRKAQNDIPGGRGTLMAEGYIGEYDTSASSRYFIISLWITLCTTFGKGTQKPKNEAIAGYPD